MEIVNVEARTYEAMMTRFERFSQRVDEICRRYNGKELKQWIDSQDVCMMLNMSPRTLQTLREKRKLCYTMIGHKVFYRPEDIQQLLENTPGVKEVRYGK